MFYLIFINFIKKMGGGGDTPTHQKNPQNNEI